MGLTRHRCSVSTYKSCNHIPSLSASTSPTLSAHAPAFSSGTEHLTQSGPYNNLESEYLQLLSPRQETEACTKGLRITGRGPSIPLAFSWVPSLGLPGRPRHSSAEYHSSRVSACSEGSDLDLMHGPALSRTPA